LSDSDAGTAGYRFRLRHRTAKRIDSDLQEIEIEAPGLSRPAILVSRTQNESVGKNN
jgi:hypothetical protein